MNREEEQYMYDYIATNLGEDNQERFAMWLRGQDLRTVYNLVSRWVESPNSTHKKTSIDIEAPRPTSLKETKRKKYLKDILK